VLDKKNNIEEYFHSVFWLNLFLVSFVFYLYYFVFSLLLSDFFNDKNLHGYIQSYSFILFLSFISAINRTKLKKELRFDALAKVVMLSSLTTSFLYYIFAYFGYGVNSFIYSSLIGSFVSSVHFIFVSKYFPKLYFSIDKIKRLINFSIHDWSINIFSNIGKISEAIIISKMLNVSTIGFLHVARQISVKIPSLLFNVLNGVGLAHMSNSSFKYKSDLFHLQSRFFSYLIIPVLLMIFFLSEYVSLVMPNWTGIEIYIKFFAIIVAIGSVLGSVSVFLKVLNKINVQTKISIFYALYIITILPSAILLFGNMAILWVFLVYRIILFIYYLKTLNSIGIYLKFDREFFLFFILIGVNIYIYSANEYLAWTLNIILFSYFSVFKNIQNYKLLK
jgi:teichuronic acid exporter